MAEASRKRVLVVDDDPYVLSTVSAILESLGYDVTSFEGANPAIAHLATEQPDAILTDIHMADGDGLELINAVRNAGAKIPVVAMSGGSGALPKAYHLEAARKLGAVAVIDKPFRLSLVVEAIDRAIGSRGAPPRPSIDSQSIREVVPERRTNTSNDRTPATLVSLASKTRTIRR